MSKKLWEFLTLRKALFIVGEGVLIYLSVLVATVLLWRSPFSVLVQPVYVLKMLLITGVIQVVLYFNDLYEIRKKDDLVVITRRVGRAMGISCILLAGIYALFPSVMLGKGIVIFSLFVLSLFIGSWRLLYAFSIKRHIMTERILLLGLGKLSSDIAREIVERKDLAYNIVAIATIHDAPQVPEGLRHARIKHGYEDLYPFVAEENVECIIAAMDERRGAFPVDELLRCKVNGIEILDGADFYERVTGKLIVERIKPSWLIFSDGFRTSYMRRFFKRILDLACSLGGLIVLSPLLGITALLIKLESRGPVLFAQERLGRNEKPFMLYKFRSMRTDAEKNTGPVWAGEDDPRITRIGKFIRKTRIDEIPQLWNVLKGEMSIVGPRPEREFFVKKLEEKIPYYAQRFCVKPGLTGWAQIMFSYGATEEDAAEKLRYELYYIKNMTIIFDLVIIFATLKTVILRRGAQ